MIIKEFSELCYWMFKRLFQKELNNSHYKYFFTNYFSLSDDDYKNKSILDIGCGPRGSLEWAEMALQRVGLDPLADKYRKLGTGNHKMEYKKANAENIPFPDNTFDIVSSFNSLDHVESVEKACDEIKRVLKSGGIFLLIVDVRSKPTITEPQTIKWSIIEDMFPEFEVIEEKHLQVVKKNKLYSNLRAGKELEDGVKEGILVVKTRSTPPSLKLRHMKKTR